MFYRHMDSPVGTLLVAGDELALREIHFPDGKRAQRPKKSWEEKRSAFREAARQLDAYFAGRLQDFDLPLEPAGTPFQLRVWQALREIPYGETISYDELARSIDRPGAPRAVGAANGRNPLPIVIPCHRVIGSNGSLTGFGGGLTLKRALLDLEQRVVHGERGQVAFGFQ